MISSKRLYTLYDSFAETFVAIYISRGSRYYILQNKISSVNLYFAISLLLFLNALYYLTGLSKQLVGHFEKKRFIMHWNCVQVQVHINLEDYPIRCEKY